MSKFINPLLDAQPAPSAKSESSNTAPEIESVSAAMSVVSADICPKCQRATVDSKLANSETVKFCTTCSVTMAIPK